MQVGSRSAAEESTRDVFERIVIARGAKRAVAIQPFDRLTALSRVEGLDCFVVPQSGSPRNDRIRRHVLTHAKRLKISSVHVESASAGFGRIKRMSRISPSRILSILSKE
jgi:hypothetical protein